MNKTILATMIGLSFAMTAYAANPSWLDASASLTDQALSAKKSGVNPGTAALAIAAAGADAQFSVQATVVAYASCPALEESVREVVTNDPGSAYDVVAGIQNLESCPCSTDSMWSHARLESRVRVPSRRFESVGLGVQSNCVAVAASEAVKAAPNQARAVFSAVAGDPLGGPGTDAQGRRVVDVVGMVGSPRETWQGEMAGKSMTIERKDSSCISDRDPANGFNVDADWVSTGASDPNTLGKVSGRCRESAEGLVLSEYQTDGNSDNAVEVSNKSPIDVDLTRGGYVLDVYGDSGSTPQQTLMLRGTLKAGKSLLVSDDSIPEEAREQAAVVVDDLDVKNVNALVLRRMPVARTNCENVPIALGMIATALGDDGEKWLDDTASEYESEANLQQIDAVGTVGMPPQDWLGSKAGQPLTVVRQDSSCEGDGSASDSFNGAQGWSVQEGVSAATAGNKNCSRDARDLVLSEYQNDAERYRTVSVLNKTGAQINLDSSGYILEIYADGASTPTRTIQLKGNLSNDQALVLVDEDAPADVKAQATLVTGELKVEKISALVLKRVGVVGGRTCQAEVVASARDIRLPLELTSASGFAATREPRSDDTLASGRRGGEVASPN